MKKTRAAGGGRKPLTTTEPTVKVAITLLPSQVEAMKELGDGNLSAGIRKAIENMNTQTYFITEEHLGSQATEANARLMVDLLREHGHDVEYGEPMRRNPEPPFNDNEWAECLDLISKM